MPLSKAARSKLPARDFAGPGRSYPVENKAHARAAMMDSKDAPKSERAGTRACSKASRISVRPRATACSRYG